MEAWEKELKEALQRREPPEGFSRRVICRIQEEVSVEKPRRPGREVHWADWIRFPQWRWLAAASMILIGMWWGIGRFRQGVQEEQRGELAKRQVLLALQITSKSVQHLPYRLLVGERVDLPRK